MSQSHCIYCNSDSFGVPCLFSPTNTHVHMGEASKCIYCGSTSVGSGCLYNPYNKIHTRGPEFLNRSNIQAERALILNYITDQITQENSLDYLSPLDRFYKRISYIISHTSEPLMEALSLQETPVYSSVEKSHLIKAYKLKMEIVQILENLREVIKDASLSITPELVEETILDAIISAQE